MKTQMFLNRWLSETTSQYSKKKHVLNQAAIMAGARVVGMGMAAVGQVWAARCLGPHNLGISGMVQNIVAQAMLVVGIISPSVLVREYKQANNPGNQNKIVQATNGFRLLVAFVFCAVAALFMAFKLVPSEYHFAGWFFIPLFLLTAIQPAWLFQAAEKQHFQSMIAVIQPTLAALIYFVWFKPGMSAGADLAVNSMVALVLAIVYWRAIYKLTTLKGAFFNLTAFEEMKALILRSRWLFVSGMATYIYTTLEQPLLGWFYSLDELGKYRTAVTSANALQSFFVIVLSLLYPRFLEWRKRGENILWNRQLKLASIVLVIGLFSSLVIFLIVPKVYPFIFGEKFITASIPCAILLISKFSILLNGIFLFGLMTDHKYDRAITFTTVGVAVLSLGLNLFFIPRFGMYATSIINFSSETALIFVYLILSKSRFKKITQNELYRKESGIHG